jgi:hypothetical protein
MKAFKNAWFQRFAEKQGISDQALRDAVNQAEKGLIDADLGGGVIKQRVARQGQGKSGGFRTIVFYRKDERAFFIYGFAKSDRANLKKDEEEGFRKLAKEMLAFSEEQIKKLVAAGKLVISANLSYKALNLIEVVTT